MIFTSMAELKLEMALTDAVAASTRGRQQQDFLQKADGGSSEGLGWLCCGVGNIINDVFPSPGLFNQDPVAALTRMFLFTSPPLIASSAQKAVFLKLPGTGHIYLYLSTSLS